MPRTYTESESVVLGYVRARTAAGEDISMDALARHLNVALPRERDWNARDATAIAYSLIGTGEMHRCVGSYRELHVRSS